MKRMVLCLSFLINFFCHSMAGSRVEREVANIKDEIANAATLDDLKDILEVKIKDADHIIDIKKREGNLSKDDSILKLRNDLVHEVKNIDINTPHNSSEIESFVKQLKDHIEDLVGDLVDKIAEYIEEKEESGGFDFGGLALKEKAFLVKSKLLSLTESVFKRKLANVDVEDIERGDYITLPDKSGGIELDASGDLEELSEQDVTELENSGNLPKAKLSGSDVDILAGEV